MLSNDPLYIVGDGRSQAQRRLAPLQTGYFQPMEQSFEQLLAMAAEYARLVRLAQPEGQADGDWYRFFRADETILMATVLSCDTGRMLARFEARLARAPQFRDWFGDDQGQATEGGYRDRFDSPLLLARALDDWLLAAGSQQGAGARAMHQLLEGILRGLRGEMPALLASVPPPRQQALPSLFSPGFRRSTGLDEARAPADFPANELRPHYHTLLQAVRMLQDGLRATSQASLTSGQHDPGAALLIAFIRLCQKLQPRLNRFGDQRLDFYYQRVLGMRPRGQAPDSACLVLTPAPGARRIEIAAGTEFLAGKDSEQRDIVYAAERAATLGEAQVAALHTLYFERRGGAAQRRTLGGFQRPCELLPADGDEQAREALPPLPLMGAPKPGAVRQGDRPVRLGFALASRVLLLGEGERTVRVQLHYRAADGAAPPIEDVLLRHGARAGDAASLNDVFVKLLRGMFRISFSTPQGWSTLPAYRPSYHVLDASVAPDCLQLECVLPPSAPPVVGYDPALHGPGYATELPLMRFEMAQNDYAYPYDILAGWMLGEVGLEVAVRGMRQLLLYSQVGQLSAQTPFLPFGPLPATGAYLVFGCEELLYKQLRDLSLDIEWRGLPGGLGGFPEHYEAYAQPLRSDAVRAGLAVLSDGKWLAAGPPLRLFGYEARQDGSPSNITSAQCTVGLGAAAPFHRPSAGLPGAGAPPFGYGAATMNGLFRLTLEGPAGAFGHQEYPLLLSQTLTRNAQVKKGLPLAPLPKPPYTPEISRLALNYRAAATIRFEQGSVPQRQDSLFHLHPLGQQTVLAGGRRVVTQIPTYDEAGYLFIGLSARELRGTLSLYFYLREDSLPLPPGAKAGLAWHYLVGDRWQALAPERILEDGTHGFMNSGIVQLQLPDEIDSAHGVMPDGLYWLCVTARDGVECFCSLYSVYAQAIKVSWQPGYGSKPQAVLPAGRITRSRQLLPGVDGIFQIRRSFGGREAEDSQQFRLRAGERLRHRNRALSAADVELLVLERYPQVYKVKCFPHLAQEDDPRRRQRPGQMLLVPLPYLPLGGPANQRPTLGGHLLQEIAQYVARHAGPDVNVVAANPVYEEIQVRCTVRLSAQFERGRCGEQLQQELNAFLSPWHGQGISQHFGWSLRQHEVEAFLLGLGYVEEVSGMSLLQVVPDGRRDERRYTLRDNARPGNGQTIHPSYPWSVAVPMQRHSIELANGGPPAQAQSVGIGKLQVGATFIIPKRTAV